MRRQRHEISPRAGIVTGILLLLFSADIFCLNRFERGNDLPRASAILQGQPVVASADGRVVGIEKIDDLDQAVYITHGSAVTTRYGHMAAVDVRRGQLVRSGDVIGRVADQLRFEVRVAGRPVPILASASSPGMDERSRRFATLYGKGDALLTSNAEAALENYREALRLWEGKGDRQEESIALFGVSRAEKNLGRLDEAQKAFERALKLMKSVQGRQPGNREVYDFAIDLLMEKEKREPGRGFESAAFELSERGRASALLASLESRLESVRALKLREIQESLDSGTLILSYWLGDERSFLWVVGRDSIASRQLAPRQEIESAATRAYLALSESNRRGSQASAALAARNLSRLLLGPVDEETLGQKRLVIVPDGALSDVPFAALPDPAEAGRPLLDRHEIVSLASASERRALQTKSRPAPQHLIAVIADPVFGGGPGQEERSEPDRARSVASLDLSRLPSLPSSRLEAERILNLAPGNSLRVTGFSANRDFLMSGGLSDFRYLHFATHGITDTQHPERSGLVLSLVDREGRRQDGLLRPSDIRNLRLSADLVVLSSCRTGQASLVRSFRDAGASRVIASLWNVDDQATAELMSRFYEALLRRNLPPAAALREAQQSMLESSRWAAPYYWAAFVLQGEWK